MTKESVFLSLSTSCALIDFATIHRKWNSRLFRVSEATRDNGMSDKLDTKINFVLRPEYSLAYKYANVC